MHLVGFIIRNIRVCSNKISPPPSGKWRFIITLRKSQEISLSLLSWLQHQHTPRVSSTAVCWQDFYMFPSPRVFKQKHYVFFSAYLFRAVRLVDHTLMNYIILIIFRKPTFQNVPQSTSYSIIIYFYLGSVLSNFCRRPSTFVLLPESENSFIPKAN